MRVSWRRDSIHARPERGLEGGCSWVSSSTRLLIACLRCVALPFRLRHGLEGRWKQVDTVGELRLNLHVDLHTCMAQGAQHRT